MTQEVKHTPGPWALSGRTATCIRTADQEQHIAYMETADNTVETCLANAHLIAAAPDLLLALKSFMHNNSVVIGLPLAARAARAAIAKAEGRS